MNAGKGPKASRVQTYKPPSAGYRDERSSTQAARGTKNPQRAVNQTAMAEGPVAAAVAIQRRLSPETT